jgi:teichuronic acid biosynthesis glycosyltransferase TuaH
MLRDSDIIILSLSRWDAAYSSPSFSLAKEFSKNNRVFYIDHPFSVKDFLRNYGSSAIQIRKDALLRGKNIYRRSGNFPEGLTMVTPRITFPINFLPKGFFYDFLARWNDRIVFETIRRIIQDFKVKDFIFFNAFDPFFCRDFPPDIKPLKTVYQSMDDLTEVSYTARHGKRLEEDIVRKFDITLTTSQELRRLKLAFSDNVFLHPNAADFSSFQRALSESFPRPEELVAAEGRKIIGYTGNIESRIDYELLKALIEFHQDKVIVMVGPVTTGEHKTIGLTEYPNVIMTGARKIDELPHYLRYFDCAIIPFKKNKLTRSIYPLKINEYLAAGRPVVATDFSEDIKGFEDVIYLARDHEEFIGLIDRAIVQNGPEKIRDRTLVANKNTWAARVETFWEILENHS